MRSVRASFVVSVLTVVTGAGMLGAGSASCTSSDSGSTPAPTTEAGPRREGSVPTPPETTCPSSTPVDAQKLPWKNPTPPQAGKCQEDDLAAMRQFLVDEPNATNEELEAFLKNRDATCHGCVFGDANGASWPPIPLENNRVVTFNVGACYAIVTGLLACGQAVQNEWDCELEACAQCTGSDELLNCRAKARMTTCKPIDLEINPKCAGAPSADGRCGGPFDSIREQCVGASADAGADGG